MSVEEQATGVRSAHGYKDYAKEQGYPIVEVLDWTSSAGDWQFIVSNNNKSWRILTQENNYPRAGFSYRLDEEVFEGTKEEVLDEIYNRY